jgi:hypothetical protein
MGNISINQIFIPVLGLFATTLIASVFAIFDGLSQSFEISLFVLGLTLFIEFRNSYVRYIRKLFSTFLHFSFLIRTLFICILILAAMQSATAPYLVDNESYYLPTIKWLDTYGFVPGLANLHIFLGQTSGWHICQSALNLEFLYSEFNDINGFFLLIGTFYAFDKLNDFLNNKNDFHLLIIGLFPLFSVLLFQFISSPSPDLPVYVLTLLITGEYLTLSESDSSGSFILVILVLFIIYVKVTAILLLIIPLLMIRNLSRKEIQLTFAVSVICGGLFMTKNIITTGYPFYPLKWFSAINVSWRLPESIIDFIGYSAKSDILQMSYDEYDNSSNVERFYRWLMLPKLHGVFNILMVLLLVVFPFFSKKLNRNILIIYGISFIHFLLLLSLSPQYRFFLGYILFLSSVLFAVLLSKKVKMVKILIGFGIFLVVVPLFFNFTVSTLTQNHYHFLTSRFKIQYLFKPHQKTRYTNATYKPFEGDNTIFYSPTNIDFFWGVGNGPLPTVQKKQYEYFKKYFKVVPEKRSTNLKDGFYSKKKDF